MPSFDIVSEINIPELSNAVHNTVREVETRFDFRGVEASVILNDLTVTLKSASDFQVKQLYDLLCQHCSKRHVSMVGVEMEEKPVHSGKTWCLNVRFKQGIEQADAKEIVKVIKESKVKVQTSIQGDKIRVSGKKRDDLQATIVLLKEKNLRLPLQFENFRD